MNYRHIYHAGNICDVVKHAVLTLWLERLREKDTPFAVLDTHAGIGLYDLDDERAAKTAEAQEGVMRLAAVTTPLPQLAGYYDILRSVNPGWIPGSAEGLRFYPGSPLIAARLLRAQDRLVACELHEEDAVALKYNLRGFKQAQIHQRDGYEALRALLPPPEKRGLILIDPPYESPDEFARLPVALAEAHKRWPQAGLMLWYPIKERPVIWRLHEALARSGMPKILKAEFVYREETRANRLNGSGLILINPPWKLDESLRALFAQLKPILAPDFGSTTIDWLNL